MKRDKMLCNLIWNLNYEVIMTATSTFSIFIFDLVLQWMVEMGGIEYFEKKSIDQSRLIYDYLDTHDDIFTVLEKSELQ